VEDENKSDSCDKLPDELKLDQLEETDDVDGEDSTFENSDTDSCASKDTIEDTDEIHNEEKQFNACGEDVGDENKDIDENIEVGENRNSLNEKKIEKTTTFGIQSSNGNESILESCDSKVDDDVMQDDASKDINGQKGDKESQHQVQQMIIIILKYLFTVLF
jgi:hypothetical protein